jgi:hypothetical protein
MDRSIRAKFRGDRHVLGPFLGNLPPEILDAVVRKLGWFQTTFAMAGRSCREAVERVPSTRAELTDLERASMTSPATMPLAVAMVDGDVEALEWLIQLFDGKGLEWRWNNGVNLSSLAARRGKIESLTCLRANGCEWDELTCSQAAWGGHLEMLQWLRQNGCPWDAETCTAAACTGHLEVLQWAHQNGCQWEVLTWMSALECCLPYLIEHGCPGSR